MSEEKKADSCASCAFFGGDENLPGWPGYCKKRSPIGVGNNAGDAVWPKVWPYNWCGDYQRSAISTYMLQQRRYAEHRE